MRRALIVAFVLLAVTPAQAAGKTKAPPIVLMAVVPTLATNFTGGDEVSQLMTARTGIFLIGTLENATSPLVTSPSLGGSDGFITSLDSHGAKLWELRLGSAGDDVATAGYQDALGNIWITGSSAISISGNGATPGLNRLTIWEVSAAGILENTFTKDLTDIDIPTAISMKGSNFIIQGLSNKVGFPTFSVFLTSVGVFGSIKGRVSAPVTSPKIFSTTSATYLWQSFVTTKGIKGVMGFPAHQSTNLLLKRAIKGKTLKGAYLIQGAPIALRYQSGVGVVVLSQGAGTYFLTVLHTK